MPVYAVGNEIKPAEIAKQGLAEAKKKNVDVVIMDTAGRLQVVGCDKINNHHGQCNLEIQM